MAGGIRIAQRTHDELARFGRRGALIAARMRRLAQQPRLSQPDKRLPKAPIELSIAQLDRDFPHLRGAELELS